MTIINHINPSSPILEWHPKPLFKTKYEKEKYWSEQKKLWIEGIGDIPPTLVHKTQEQKIKNRNTGVIFRPIARDVDLLIHENIRDCRRNGEALVIIKARGIGLSAEDGCLANYFMKVYPGTTTLLTSCDKPKIASLFSEKVAVTFDQYDDDIKPVEVRRNETATSCYLKTEQIYIDQDGKTQTNSSQIICRETSDSPSSASAFSGQGAIFGAYDEIFLHKRRNELMRSSTSCYVEQSTGITTGFLLANGTVEDTLTNEQLAELQLLIEEIQRNGRLGTMKARLLFIPAWLGKFMVNGHSNEQKGREWWSKEIDALEKLKDPKAVRAFRMNNPMSLEDIFELNKGGVFEDDVSDMIKAQYKIVTNNPPSLKRVKLIDINGSVQQHLDKKGNIEILEEPKSGVGYYLNIDGVATGKKAGGEEGSSVAGSIVKMFDPNGLSYGVPAVYLERPETIEQSYYALIALARYYNKFGGLRGISAEANAANADHFSTFLEKNGMGKYIVNRQDLSGKGNSNTKKSFQYVTIDVRDFQIKAGNIFLRKYIGNIQMPSLLLDLMKTMSENADIRDSWFMWFVTPGGRDYDKIVTKPMERPKQPTWRIVVGADGKTKWIESK